MQKYKGICIELGADGEKKFLKSKTPKEIKRVKKDILWSTLHCSEF